MALACLLRRLDCTCKQSPGQGTKKQNAFPHAGSLARPFLDGMLSQALSAAHAATASEPTRLILVQVLYDRENNKPLTNVYVRHLNERGIAAQSLSYSRGVIGDI